VLWSVDPADWQPGVTANQLTHRVLAAARPGAIVLHDGGGDRSATIKALPAIIDGLRRLASPLPSCRLIQCWGCWQRRLHRGRSTRLWPESGSRGALIASDLSNAPLRANAANRVTGYDQASLLAVGPVGPEKEVEPGPWTMPTPPPRHLTRSRPRHLPASRPRSLPTSRPRHLPRSRPRHLTTSRWPWRLGLLALGLTTGVLAALVTSAILLSPQPPLARQTPVLGLLTVPAQPAARSVATSTTGPPEPTTAPTRSTLTAETRPRRAVSRPTSAPGPGTAQVSATADTTTTEAFSTVGATSTQPPVTAPTTAAPTTTVSTTTAAPTTTLATTTSTQPTTTGPATTGAEPTTTTGPAVP
jgi:hypothetical protein